MYRLLIFFCALLVSVGCEKKSVPEEPEKTETPRFEAVAEAQTVPLLASTMQATLVEASTDAIPSWRRFAKLKPALILMANDPFLAPLPDALEDDIIGTISKASDDELLSRFDSTRANTLIFPVMAVEAALKAELFSAFYWVLPNKVAIDELSLETFRDQLLGLGAIDESEAATLTMTERGIEGKFRGFPFAALLPTALPPMETPVFLHIDLSFFEPIYKGEIKTPLYPLLLETFGLLRKAEWQSYGVTVSQGNLSGALPLKTRFLGPDIVEVFGSPSLIDEGPHLNWRRRANALYLENFFQPEKIHELYLEMEADSPQDASVKFALYHSSRNRKDGDKALEYLAQAVALDPVYALEYLNLADVAIQKGRPQKKIEMLLLALHALPDHLPLKLKVAQALLEEGDRAEGLKLANELEKAPWSPVYYKGISDLLGEMRKIPETSKEKE